MKGNISNAIELLRKCVDEDIPHLRTLNHDNQDYILWEIKILIVLKETFGIFTEKYQEFVSAGKLVGTFSQNRDYQKLYILRLSKRELCLKKIIQEYDTKKSLTIPTNSQIQAPVDSTEMANFLFDKMQLHPKVIEVSMKLFIDGHYAQAIEEAYKAVINSVKEKASLHLDDKVDGTKLMAQVFHIDNPMIKLNKLKTQPDRDEQEGFMHLFMGATLGIRNPKAHSNIVMKDPYKTLEYLGFASLLMRRADEGKLDQTWKKQSKSKQS